MSISEAFPARPLVLLSQKVAFWELAIVDNFGRFVFRHKGAEMDHPKTADSASRFEAYVEGLVGVIGHADRATTG